MSEFIEALNSPAGEFLRCAVLAGLLVSIACGVVGTYVVARRITYVAGGIAHCVLGGIGAAVYCNKVLGCEWISPMAGAVFAALLSAGIIGVVSLKCREREDTVISALWATGMAAGVFFIWKTPGYQQGLMNYMFGNILMVSPDTLMLIGALDLAVIVVSVVFYRQFMAVCFDEEFARTRGVRVDAYYLLLLAMTALTVVLLVNVVGVIMVIALLTLPVATGGQFTKKLWQMMVAGTLISMLLTLGGIAISYGPDYPSGATIIILAGLLYLFAVIVRTIVGRVVAWKSQSVISDECGCGCDKRGPAAEQPNNKTPA